MKQQILSQGITHHSFLPLTGWAHSEEKFGLYEAILFMDNRPEEHADYDEAFNWSWNSKKTSG